MAGKGCIINLLRSRCGRIAALCLCAALLAAAGILLRPRPSADPPPQPPDGLTAYDVTLKLLPDTREISITEKIAYCNDTGDDLTALTVRTWLNAYQREETSPAAADAWHDVCYPEGFSEGRLTLYDVLWDGKRASWRYGDEAQTALEIMIPRLRPGEKGVLTLRCTGLIPVCAHRIGVIDGAWQLGNAIPSIPLYQDHAFRTDPYSPIGDPFVSPCADYTVHLYAPADYLPACSAPLERAADGSWHGAIRGARDIALCVSPAYQTAEDRAGQTRLYACARTKEAAQRSVQIARRAIETLERLFGPYPYPQFTVCAASFPFGGMEYSGMAMVGESNYLDGSKDALEATLVHEAAHQWFYSLVGSDQVYAPWQDEALCQFALLRYARARYGQGSFESLRYELADAPMMENIPGSLTPGSPIDYFGSLNDYSAVVYGRGTALLLALDELTQGRMDAFLRAYAEKFTWQFVPRADFEAFLNQYMGMDCSPLMLDYLDTAH